MPTRVHREPTTRSNDPEVLPKSATQEELWHGDLRDDAQTQVIFLQVGRIEADGPEIISLWYVRRP